MSQTQLAINKQIDDQEFNQAQGNNSPTIQVQNKNEQTQDYPINNQLEAIEQYPMDRIKPDAIEFDIKLGWIPRAQITGPIPVAFPNQQFDEIIQDKSRKLIYLGYRPTNTFDIHKQFYNNGLNYPFKQFHLCKSQFLVRFFKEYYSQYEFQSKRQIGSKENPQSQLEFNSFFQGGNLDAVYLEDDQYVCIIRNDTNTKGHCNFFSFKAKCKKPGTYRFKIANITKKKSLYNRGMKPYTQLIRTYPNGYSQKSDWVQKGQKIKFGQSSLCEQYQLKKKTYSLKFDFSFQMANDEVHFCYGIPYTYSDLLKDIEQYKKSPFVHVGKLCFSLSGVQIPLITITQKENQDQQPQKVQEQPVVQNDQDKEQNEQGEKKDDKKQNQGLGKKFVVVITGRIHPGETHGSHIICGFIKQLLNQSSNSKFLRSNVIFKIIPMMNPDGVIIGNTRTSFAGKDLNRVFSKKPKFVFPQVIGIQDYVKKIKQKYKNKFQFLIDIHGHSTRKNSFYYGPQYPVFDIQYMKCRLLPKFYSQRTDIFRYYSCKFRISEAKENTSRGYFNNFKIVRTYTHQTSMFCFYDFETRADKAFDIKILQKLGKNFSQALFDYFSLIYRLPRNTKIGEKDKKILDTKRIEYNRMIDEDPEQCSNESDKDPSDQADSESQNQDWGDQALKVFYEKIDKNRLYFYEELFHQDKFIEKQQKKKKKKQQNNVAKIQANKPKVEKVTYQAEMVKPSNLMEMRTKTKIDWIAKADYHIRKKNVQEYTKLSSVVFGSQGYLPIDSQKNQYKTQKKIDRRQDRIPIFAKYTISTFNVDLNKVNDEKNHNSQSTPSLLKHETDANQPKNKFKFGGRTKIKFLQGEKNQRFNPNKVQPSSPQKQLSKPRQLFDEKSLQKVLEKKNLPLITQNRKYREEKIVIEYSYKSTSLKSLPRKKSIKSFSQEKHLLDKKTSKFFKSSWNLTNKLPSLSSMSNPNYKKI